MCGICGAYGLSDKGLLHKMRDIMEHRGPDDKGEYLGQWAMLGNRRLSIIDLSTGKQPIFNENKDKVIVFNGEIYNYRELKSVLEGKGHRFSTHSDTEVIVHAYEEYGKDCVKKLNGEFAFAIWDDTTKELFLARDRAGVKPLFYYSAGGAFIFASEVKAILQYPALRKEIDPVALHYLVNLRYIPHERTMFKGIYKLLPGHTLTVSRRGMNFSQYWKAEIAVKEMPLEYYAERLKAVLESSIKRYLVADVPLGAFLSGGLDTSTIVAYASKLLDKPLHTFCMGFKEPTDEFNDAKMVAEHFGTEHKEIIAELDLAKTLPSTLWAIDMPKRNMWPYFIHKEVSKHTKVVLGGTGGDEIFGGYTYRYSQLENAISMRAKGISMLQAQEAQRKLLEQIEKGKMEEDYKLLDYERVIESGDTAASYSLISHSNKLCSRKEYLKKVYGEKLLGAKLPECKNLFRSYFANKKNKVLENAFIAEFNTKMVDDFLLIDDASSMAHSIEARAPFLDAELVELCFQMPTAYKFHGGTGKLILRKAMQGVLPQEILAKKKWGFVPNISSWYQKEFRSLAEDILPGGQGVKQGYFNKTMIQKILEHPYDKNMEMHYNLIWDMLVFEVWHKIYMEQDVKKNPQLSMNALF